MKYFKHFGNKFGNSHEVWRLAALPKYHEMNLYGALMSESERSCSRTPSDWAGLYFSRSARLMEYLFGFSAKVLLSPVFILFSAQLETTAKEIKARVYV